MHERPLRLPPGADLRSSLEDLARRHYPAGAFVVAGIGSLQDPHLRLADGDEGCRLSGPHELLTLSGTITAEGAHLHASVAAADGSAIGGHVMHGCAVHTTAELLLAPLSGWRLLRAHDPGTGYAELQAVPDVAPEAEAVLSFWFEELEPAQWWRVDPALDEGLRARFGALHASAAVAELSAWRTTARGRLAEVIVLDQFSRNLFRGTPRAFACDPLALALAQEAVAAGVDGELPPPERAFLYMPFMHSESARVHAQALQLFSALGLQDSLASELQHKAIVDRFGRYPHRNQILGRPSTEEERVFLAQAGSRF